MITRIVHDLAETEALAEILATHAVAGDVLLLFGDLGAGKTAFSRAFIRALMQDPVDVPSPTFTLVQTYEARNVSIWHFDLYRLHTRDEIFELGFEEALVEGVSLIEWPERLEGMTFPQGLILSFTHNDADSPGRCITLEPRGRWVEILGELYSE